MHKGSTGILYLKAVKDGILSCHTNSFALKAMILLSACVALQVPAAGECVSGDIIDR